MALDEFLEDVCGQARQYNAVQRQLWERVLNKRTDSAVSVFVCQSCGSARFVSVCLACQLLFCREHFGQKGHTCVDPFGVDVETRQLFAWRRERREFVFSGIVDRRMLGARLMVLEDVSFNGQDFPCPIVTLERRPRHFPDLGRVDWLQVACQCMFANPALAKWFSQRLELREGRELALHLALSELCVADHAGRSMLPAMTKLCTAIFKQCSSEATQVADPYELLKSFARWLDPLYEAELGVRPFEAVMSWRWRRVAACGCGAEASDVEAGLCMELTVADGDVAVVSAPEGSEPCRECGKSRIVRRVFANVPRMLTLVSPAPAACLTGIQDSLSVAGAGFVLYAAIVRHKPSDRAAYRGFFRRSGSWWREEEGSLVMIELPAVLQQTPYVAFYLPAL